MNMPSALASAAYERVPAPHVKLDRFSSDRMRVVRVLAIALVTLVHIQPGRQEIAGAPQTVDIARFFGSAVLGSASVPVLSMIAGFLFLTVASNRRYEDYVRGRFRSLYLPMIVWSGLTAVLLLALGLAGIDSALGQGLRERPLYESLLALGDKPINYPLYFLRDMFVISLFSPVLIRLSRSAPQALLAACLALYYLDAGWPILLKPVTLLFFAAGMVIYTKDLDHARVDRFGLPVAIFAVLFWSGWGYAALYADSGINVFEPGPTTELVNRLLVGTLLWIGSGYIARSSAMRWFARLEKRIYVVFLSHLIVILVLGGVFARLVGTYASTYYLGLMLITPPVCLLAGAVCWQAIQYLPAPLQIAFAGKANR